MEENAHEPNEPPPASQGPESVGAKGSPGPLLPWPPPGLGGSVGEAWKMLAVAGVGAGLLAFPLLWAIARDQPLWSLGPFGDAWWILPLAALAGLAVMGSFFWRLFLLLTAAAKNADRGHGLRMIFQVAADGRGDTGFLLQGARYYAGLGASTRRGLLNLRLWGVYLYLAGVLWIPVGCALSLVLAARGVFSTGGVWMVTLAPAGVLAVAGMACRGAEEATIRKARRQWFTSKTRGRELPDEVERWNDRFLRKLEPEGMGIGDRLSGGSFRGASVGVVFLALLVAVPSMTLAVTGAVGPVVASLALPSFSGVQRRMAEAEPLRRLTVEKDPRISPREAGDAFNAIANVGREARTELERPPLREYESPWILPGLSEATGVVEGKYFGEELMDRWASGELTPAEWQYLREAAVHPAHRELTALARAPEIDVVSTRWELPFPDSLTPMWVPIPRLSGVREAGYARVAQAVVAAEEGRLEDADRALREAISAGLLLADQGPTLIDNLIGTVVAINAGANLVGLYRVTGREDDARRLDWALTAARGAAGKMRQGAGTPSLEGQLRQMHLLVGSDEVLLGLRWEYYFLTNTLASCLNLHSAVFGPGLEYQEWLASSRQALVRWPGDEALFELGRNGYLGAAPRNPVARLAKGLFSLTLGGGSELGSCSILITGLD